MNRNKISWVPTQFGPETRFEVSPTPAAPFRATEDSGLDRLKLRLLRDTLTESDPKYNAYIRRAANEAAALAWTTPYPALLFPALFEEKTRTAIHQADRQACVRVRSLQWMAA